jgi:hypothetical protein
LYGLGTEIGAAEVGGEHEKKRGIPEARRYNIDRKSNTTQNSGSRELW